MSVSVNKTRWVLFLIAFLIALVPIGAEYSGEAYLIDVFTRFLIYAIAAVSLDLVLGYGAMVSFGHAMFFGVGGYVAAVLSFHKFEGIPLFGWEGTNQALISWPIALAVCAVLGAIVGFFALRTRGVQFIMITLAFAQLVYFLLVSLQIYGGDDGLLMLERNELPFINLEDPLAFFYLCFISLLVWLFICRQIINSKFGLVLQAIRQTERRVVNLGAQPKLYRLLAFVWSGVGTGFAGVLYGNYAHLVTPDMASWMQSGEFMAMVVLGGVGTLYGAVVGAAVFLGLEQALNTIWDNWQFAMGPILVLVVLFGRKGLVGRFFGGRFYAE